MKIDENDKTVRYIVAKAKIYAIMALLEHDGMSENSVGESSSLKFRIFE